MKVQRKHLLLIIAIATIIVLVFAAVMMTRPPATYYPQLNVTFVATEISLPSFTEDLEVNVTISFPEKETWDLGEVPWFIDTITLEKSIPVKGVEGMMIARNSLTYTLIFDNTLVKNLLWSKIYHMDASTILTQKIMLTVYGDWQGTEISDSEELAVRLDGE